MVSIRCICVQERGGGLVVALGLILAALLAGCAPSVYTLRQRGLAHYQAERYDQAKRAFERAVDREPSDPQANYYLGRLALHSGNVDEARNHLEIAYSLYEAEPVTPPHMPRLLDALAKTMYRQGEHRQVITFTEQAIERFGTLRDYLRKAEYLARIGDHDSALTAYRTAVEIAEPGDARPHLALADFYESIGDRQRAIDALKQAYRANPENQEAAERLRAYGIVPGPTLFESEPQA